MKDNTQRFSDRVGNYSKYRPTYPKEMLDYLREHFGVNDETIIADIGSGTGKLTELLLPFCKVTLGVEPNTEMRLEAEKNLSANQKFKSISGTAENTTLAAKSVDLITVAQAFHWFDRAKVKIEFSSILKDQGYVLIITNKRVFSTPFLREYEEILHSSIAEYKEVNHYKITPEEIKQFYTSNYEKKDFENKQTFDWDGVIGRLCSSSYTPKQDSKEYIRLEKNIRRIFDTYSVNGTVEFVYESSIQSGKIN